MTDAHLRATRQRTDGMPYVIVEDDGLSHVYTPNNPGYDAMGALADRQASDQAWVASNLALRRSRDEMDAFKARQGFLDQVAA